MEAAAKSDPIQRALEETFGLEEFRPAQRGVIEAALAGRDVLCVMPTGAGKSLCYQLPAVVKGGLTVVVSPLISLMDDQVRQLTESGIEAMFLNSTLDAAGRRDVFDRLDAGYDGLLYVAPERFNGNFVERLASLDVRLFAVDEAHCISQWGHDFRPEYQQMGPVLDALGRPPTMALTATATADVREDVVRSLGLDDPKIVVTGFDRPNLGYEARTIQKKAEKLDAAVAFARKDKGSGIVYCSTRKNVEEVASVLSAELPDRGVFAYHAGMDPNARASNQRQFMDTDGAIAVATNAFGMGINKPDIRWVMHYNLPGTLEAYYQEAGRAGRDGRAARCVLLYSFMDKRTQEFFIDKLGEGGVDVDVLEQQRRATQKLEATIAYARRRRCRRQQILDYFGDEAEIECGNCDVCRGGGEAAPADEHVEFNDATLLAIRQLLSAVARLNRRYGLGTVAEVLTGSDNDKLRRGRLQELPTYGLMRTRTIKQVIAMLHRVAESGLVRQVDPENTRRPVVELTAAGVKVMKGEQDPPAVLHDLAPRQRTRPTPTKADFDPDFSPEAAGRFEKLRQARTQLARDGDVPPYIVASNRTLQAIAVANPPSVEGLLGVPGMGPKKVSQYGDALLAALREDEDGDDEAEELTYVPEPE